MTEGGGGQWKLNLRLVGEALGRTNDAEGLLTDYDREVAQTRAAIRHAHPQDREQPERAGGGGALTPDGVRFAARDSFAATILADAGVRRVRSLPSADTVLLPASPQPRGRPASTANSTPVDAALWFGDGGALAARAALADLRAARRWGFRRRACTTPTRAAPAGAPPPPASCWWPRRPRPRSARRARPRR